MPNRRPHDHIGNFNLKDTSEEATSREVDETEEVSEDRKKTGLDPEIDETLEVHEEKRK